MLVGDLDAVDVDELGHAVFDGWDDADGATPIPDATPRRRGRRVVVVDRPGSVQSILLLGHDGPPRKIDDYVAMTTMSMVLGGMFSSRLNMKIREEKGYAYGAHCGFDTRKHGGVFVARTSVQSDVTIPALADTVAEIERMHAGGVEPDELEQARAYRAGVFPINFAGVMAVASGLGDLVVNDFADDHFDQLRARVLDVRKDELDASAHERLRPDDLVTVVVGDASGFVEELREHRPRPGRGRPRRRLSSCAERLRGSCSRSLPPWLGARSWQAALRWHRPRQPCRPGSWSSPYPTCAGRTWHRCRTFRPTPRSPRSATCRCAANRSRLGARTAV